MISAPISSRANFLGPPLGGTASSGKLTFPKLDYDAIIETLRKIGINDVSEKDLKSPNQQIALTCFCPFVELLSYFNDEVIESMKEECLEKLDHRVSDRPRQGKRSTLILSVSCRNYTTSRSTSSSASTRCRSTLSSGLLPH